MIEHRGKSFDDSRLRPYAFSRRVVRNFKNDECEIFVVYGMPEGIGKSAYVNHTIADVCGYYRDKDWNHIQWMWKKPEERGPDSELWEMDWEAVKRYIKYPPEEVVRTFMEMMDKDKREPCFHWDDAGTWLNSMDWHDPFVIAFMKYLSLARTNWGAIILSTPVEEWVLKKLRTATGVLHVRIIKAKDDSMIWRPRIARAYKIVRYPGRLRPYWNTVFEDYFMAIMPDSFFRWYKPRRDQYARIAVKLMRAALKKRRKRGWLKVSEEDEAVLEEIERHIDRANDRSVELNEMIDQRIQEEHSFR